MSGSKARDDGGSGRAAKAIDDAYVVRSFEILGPPILAFASRHNLELVKYYHDAPVWSLKFRHPSNGVAKIDVEVLHDSKMRLSATWWCDDYASATRSLKRWTPRPRAISASRIGSVLDHLLGDLLASPAGDWDEVSQMDGAALHAEWSASEYAAILDRLPEVRA